MNEEPALGGSLPHWRRGSPPRMWMAGDVEGQNAFQTLCRRSTPYSVAPTVRNATAEPAARQPRQQKASGAYVRRRPASQERGGDE